MNINEMLRQASKLQQDMQKAQEKLSAQIFEVVSCGGAIKINMSGSEVVQKIEISKDLIDPDDVDMLQDALLVAINEAHEKVKAESDKITSGLTSGMNFPGF